MAHRAHKKNAWLTVAELVNCALLVAPLRTIGKPVIAGVIAREAKQ
jgi:hypothetical protein